MPTSINEALKFSRDLLQSAGIPTGQLDSEILLAHVLNWSRERLWRDSNLTLDLEQSRQLDILLQKRVQGIPVAYLIQSKGFWKDDFYVDERVLVPRPETEIVIETAQKLLKTPPLRILDLGTGSGCLGLSLKREFLAAEVYGVDLLPGSLEVARRNSKILDLELRLLHLDASSEFAFTKLATKGSFDLIVANPPYIGFEENVQASVANFEPSSALYASESGYKMLLMWSKLAADLNKIADQPVTLILEIGSSQKEKVLECLQQQNCWASLGSEKDLAGFDRVVWAQSRS